MPENRRQSDPGLLGENVLRLGYLRIVLKPVHVLRQLETADMGFGKNLCEGHVEVLSFLTGP